MYWNEIKLLLIQHKKNNNIPVTHTIIPNKNNKIFNSGLALSIPLDKIDHVYEKLHDVYFKYGEKLSLTESIGELSPLIIDIDLKYKYDLNVRFYTDQTIEELIKYIYKEGTKYFTCSDWKCWVFEKKEPTYIKEDSVIKDGIHLIFPNVIGHTKVFTEFIKKITSSEENCKEIYNIFKFTSNEDILPNKGPDNNVKDIIDSKVKRWFIYGDGKRGSNPYLLTNYMNFVNEPYELGNYKEDPQDLISKNIMKKICLLKKFEKSVDYKLDIDNILIDKPINKSNNSKMFEDYSSSDDEDFDPYFVKPEEKIDIKNTLNELELKNIGLVVNNCLSDERANDYELWIRLGMCLKNIGGEKLFDVWDSFSERGDNYKNTDDCKKSWDSFKTSGNPLTRGSLNYWARLDNEKEYNKILEQNLDQKIRNSIARGGSHDDIAEVVYGLFKDQYICGDLKDSWYYFNKYKWETCPKGFKLHKALTGAVKELYYRYHQIYKKQKDEAIAKNDAEGEDTYDKSEKKAYKIYDDLKNVNFCENIMKACKYKFYVKDVMEKFDTNVDLIGFENCVFDLKDNVLREGRPEDYITLSTNLIMPIVPLELPLSVEQLWSKIQIRSGLEEEEWDNKYKPSKYFKKIYKDIIKFFKEILPDTEEDGSGIRDYCLKFIATRLSGNVLEQRFSIWTGSGGNGKSILLDLIRETFGDYCTNLPVTLLTQKRKASNAASPEKARTRGKRFCYMQEPEEKEKINAGEMKEISGGDMIQARELYSAPFEFKPQFEIILMCNEKPIIEDKTNGAWRRVQVYPFPSSFIDPAKKGLINPEKNIYPMDKELPIKLKKWTIVFMGMLLKVWEEMDGKSDYEIPKSIRMETENYKNQNDIIGQWISESLEKTDEDEVTTFNILWNCWENWFVDNHNNGRMDKNEVKKRLIEWQKKSNYGFSDINGTKSKPKINLKPIVEED
tara:strand:- start:1072 stop:3930 length:2859 start_codon:yes stop_codon:yes gene_type:complete